MRHSPLAALAAGLLLASPPSVAAAQGACSVTWSRPDTVRTDRGTRVYVSQPQVVSMRRGTLLLGDLAIESTEWHFVVARPGTNSIHHAGVLIRHDGRAEMVSAPDSVRLGFPRAARIDDNRVAVVWGDLDTNDVATTYRSSVLDTSGWHDLEIILENRQLLWRQTTHSRLLAVDGELRLLAARAGFPRGALLLRRRASDWTATDIPLGWSPYTALAPLGGDTLIVTFLGEVRNEGNTLYARRFLIDGSTLGEATRLSVPGDGQVYDPQIVLGSDSTLYAVWTAVDAVTEGVGFIGLAISTDRGVTWRSQEPYPIVNAAVGFLDVTVDRSGVLHVAFTSAADDKRAPRHLILRNGRWSASEPPRVPGTSVFGQPSLVFGRDGRMTMIWGVHDEENTVTIPPFLLSSQGRLSCTSPADGRPR